MATAFRKTRFGNRKKTNFRAPLLGLEMLEERCTPATHTWIGTTDGTWSNPANWQEGVAPANGESGPIVLNFGTLSGGTNALIDDIAGLNVDQLGFTASGYSLTGGAVGGIVLDITGATTPAILDSVGGNSVLATNTFSISLAGAATVEVDAGVDSIAAPISGGFGVTKAGSGTLVVSGANSFTGPTTVNAGTVQLGAAGSGTSTPLGSAGAVVASGAALDLNGFSLSAALPLTINGTGITSGGALLNSSTTAATYSGLLTLGAASSVIANGSITLSNAGTITGAGFGLTLGGTGTASTLVSIVGTGAGTVTKSGTGTWVVSGASTYTGATNITAGTLKLGTTGSGANTPLGTNATGTTVSSGATLDLNGKTLTAAEPLKISGTGNGGVGALVNSATTAATYSGLITLGAAALVSSGSVAGGNLVLSATGTITGSTFTLTFGGSGTASSISSIIGTGTGGVIKSGTGSWTFVGVSTYTGGVTIQAGVAVDGVNSVFSSSTGGFGAFNAAATKITVQSGGTLDIGGRSAAGTDFNYGATIAGTGSANQGAFTNTGASSSNGQACLPNITLSGDASIGGATSSNNIDMLASGFGATTLALGSHTLSKILGDSFRLVKTTITASAGGTVSIVNGVILPEGGGSVPSTNFINGSQAAFVMSTNAGSGIFMNVSTYTFMAGSISGGDSAGTGTDGSIQLSGGSFTTGYLGTSTTYSGVISLTGSFTKLGAGNLTLKGANTATASLTVKEGTLVAASSTAITTFTPLTIGDSANASNLPATLESTASYNYTHAISVVGKATNTYTIRDSGGATTYSGAISVVASDTLTFNQNATTNSNADLTISGSITGSTSTNLVLGNTGTLSQLVLSGTSISIGGTITNNGTGTSPTTISGAVSAAAASTFAAITQSSPTSPLTIGGTNTYPGVTTVSAGVVTVTGNEAQAAGGWNIGNATNTTSVTFAAGSTIGVGINGSIQLGTASSTGQSATLTASGVVSNGGALNLQRNAQLTDAGTWKQGGSMLIQPPAGSIVGTSMYVPAGGVFNYGNSSTLAPQIQIGPASGAAGSASLTIAGLFLSNQGFNDPTASSTGAAGVTLAGGTLQFQTSVPALVATAGSPFNFVLGTNGTLSGGTINISSSAAVSMNSVISGTGGLTLSGGGAFTLGGANVDTFTGDVNVTGTLNLDFTSLATPTNLLNSANALNLNNAAVNLIGNAAGSTSQTIANLSLAPVTTNSIALEPGTGTSTNLTITGTVVSGGATSAFNIDYAAGTTNGATVGNDIVAWNPTLTSGLIGAGYTVTDAGGTGYATVVAGNVVRLSASNPLPVSVGDPSQNYLVNAGFSTLDPAVPGSLIEALVGPVAAGSVSVDTTGLSTGANLQLGTKSLTLTAGMTFGGANPYTIASTTSSAGILSALAAAAIVFNNYDSSPVTIAAPILDNSGTAITLNGTGTTVFSGPNQYSGDTTISTGASLEIGDPGSLGGGNYAGNITDNGALEYSSSVPQTLAGAISGSGGITKDGSTSTLTLAGADTYTGPTVLKSGTLAVANASALSLSSSFILGDPTATVGSVVLNGIAGFNYTNPVSVVGANQTDTIVSGSNNVTFSGPVTLGGTTLTLASTSGPGILSLTGGASGTGGLIGSNSGNSVISVSGGAWNITGAVTNVGTGVGFFSIGSALGTGVTGVQQNSSTSALLLGGASTYNSGTTINAGTLQAIGNSAFTGVGNATVISNGPLGVGLLTIGANGTLDLNINSIASGGLVGSGIIGSTAASGTPTAKLTIIAGATPQTFTGTIVAGLQGGGRAVAIGLAGSGTEVIPNGSNTYGGGTSIGSGTMLVEASTTGSPGALTSGPLGTGTIALGSTANGGTLSVGGAFTIGNAITVAATPTTGANTIAGSTDNNVVVSGAIALSGNATVSQVASAGNNALTLSGNVTSGLAGTQTLTFSGPGNVLVSGVLGVGTGTIAATIAAGNVTFSGADTYVGATNVNGGTLTVNGSTSAGSTVTVGTAGTLAGIGTLAGAVVVSGAIDPGGIGAVGTMTLGTLSFGNTGVLNLDLGAASSDEIIVNGTASLSSGTLKIASSSMPIGTTVTILHSTGALNTTFKNLSDGSSITFASGIYTVHYDTTNNNVTLTFVQPPSITSPTLTTFTVGAPGTFSLMATGTMPISYSVTSGTLPNGVTLSPNGILSGTPAAGTIGTYPLVFTASNGASQDQAFTLDVYDFSSASSTSIAVGAPMTFTMTTADGSAPATISLAGTDTLPAGVTFANGVFSGTPQAGTEGSYVLHADASDGVDADAMQTFTLTVTAANLLYVSNTNFGQASAPNVGDAVDGDQGAAGTQAAIFGANALTSIANALSNIASGGTILVNAGAYAESPFLTYGGTFRISGNVTVTAIDSFQGTTIDLQGGTLTEGDSSSDDAIGGNIIGTGGSLVKVGSDALTLSGVDTYTGPTTVSAGSLLVSGSLTSSVTVDSGATLGGSGTISGAVSLAAGSVLAPGLPSTIATLNTGSLNMTTGSTFTALISGPNVPFGYDQVNVTGSVALDALSSGGATLNVSLGSFTSSPNSVFVLINNDGTDAVTGLFKTPGGVTLHNGDLFAVGSTSFRIYYSGGDGNDVTLVEASSPPIVYVSSSNFGLAAAPTVGESVDGDEGLGGTQTAVFGIDAFSSISSALAAVAPGGTVVVNAGAYAESPNLTGTGTFQLTGGNVTVSALDSAAGTTIDLQNNQLTLGKATGNDTLAGAVIGSGGLTKAGSDTLTLSGADSYFGGTSVSAGTLLVDSSLGFSTVSVGASGTLGGTGTVAGTNYTAGALSPGDTPGATATLATGSLTAGPGSLDFDLASTAAYDIVASTGPVDIDGASLNVSAALGNIHDGDTFTIITAANITGTFNGASTVTAGTRIFSITYNPTSVVLTAIPGTATTVVSTVLNGGIAYVNSPLASNQHSMVENVVYSFSQAVSLSASNFTLSGFQGTPASQVPGVVVTGSGSVWTVTFSGVGVNGATHSIGDGEYSLVLSGVPGMASNTYDFFRLLGDMDGSGTVDTTDFTTFISTFLRASTDPFYLGADDFDNTGTIDSTDFTQFTNNFLKSVPSPLPN